MKSLAIITARGGSKRIPHKNMRLFFDRPIIKYSIDAAIISNCFDEVMVSTDDNVIAEYSKKNGASIPFMRSLKNSDDYSTTSEVLLEVIESYRKIGQYFDYICCIYPTAPFITPDKLKKAYKLLLSSNCKTVIPVVKYSAAIQRSFNMEKNELKLNWPEFMNYRSQDLQPAYHDAGQFYFIRTNSFLVDKKLFTDNTLGIEIPESEVQDIDNEEDWIIAEIKYKIAKGKLDEIL